MRRELPFGNDRRKKDDDDAIVEKEDKNFEVYFQIFTTFRYKSLKNSEFYPQTPFRGCVLLMCA